MSHLEGLGTRSYVSPVWMTVIHAGLGEKDQAFQWLERVFASENARSP